MTQVLKKELEVAIRLAREAGRVALEVYSTPFAVELKPEDAGPVTLADQRANDLIVQGLHAAFPGDGVVAEESVDNPEAPRFRRCWFVDPIDGTAEFVERNGMFAVHIGLAIDGEAVLGVVFGPVPDKLYAGIVGHGAFLEEDGNRRALVMPRPPPLLRDLRLIVSRSHASKITELIRDALGITRVAEMGSVGLKAGMLAAGLADLYLHPSARSYRWDSCAPEAVLRAAGGVLADFSGKPFRYDVTDLRNGWGILGCAEEILPRILPVAADIARANGLLPPQS